MKLPRLRQKGKSFYYDTQAKPRRWIALGSNLPIALRRYERLASKSKHGTIGDMLDGWLNSRRAKLKPSTLGQYEAWVNNLKRVLGDEYPDELERADVLQYIDECTRTSAKAEISALRQAYEWAVRRREVSSNPCVSVKALQPNVSRRDRYIEDTELAAIWQAGTPLQRVAVDLAYLLALRVEDLCKLRWGDLAEHVQTGKTGARLHFTLTDDLRAVLDDAKAIAGFSVTGIPVTRVSSLTVLSERGRPVTRYRIGDLWRQACDRAGVLDAQLRDVRAKSATDADAAGQDAQKLLGHTTAQTTRTYLRGRKVAIVEPVRRRKG